MVDFLIKLNIFVTGLVIKNLKLFEPPHFTHNSGRGCGGGVYKSTLFLCKFKTSLKQTSHGQIPHISYHAQDCIPLPLFAYIYLLLLHVYPLSLSSKLFSLITQAFYLCLPLFSVSPSFPPLFMCHSVVSFHYLSASLSHFYFCNSFLIFTPYVSHHLTSSMFYVRSFTLHLSKVMHLKGYSVIQATSFFFFFFFL